MKEFPQIGERIVVHGMLHHEAKVASVIWSATFFDWIIELDWGIHGKSRVKLHDQNKTWYRWSRSS